MAKTFQFGPLRLDVEFGGLGGPTLSLFGYRSTASAPGASHTLVVMLENRIPIEAAIEHVRKMRSALKFGPERYARFIMMQERKSWREAQALVAEGTGLYAVASVVGDEALASAEQQLDATIRESEAEEEEEEAAEEAVQEALQAGMKKEFVLGAIHALVKVLGFVKEGGVAFEVSLTAPNAPAITDRAVGETPLLSSAVQWLLTDTLGVLRVGPEKVARDLITAGGPADEINERVATLNAFGVVVGPQAIQQALDAIAVEVAREEDEYYSVALEHLEERRKIVRARIEELMRRRTRGK
jgi:hypothetical protein